jgi:hypothetical protein
LVHSSFSGPADVLWPWAQDTLALPTPRVAVPSLTPDSEIVVPRTSAFAALPLRVTVHRVPEQETLSEVTVQAASGTTIVAPARSPAASRVLRVVVLRVVVLRAPVVLSMGAA